MTKESPTPDVCLILEGTYPFVSGGVSTWTHDLILAQSHLTFHLATLLPLNSNPTARYSLPKNVTGVTQIHVQGLPAGEAVIKGFSRVMDKLEAPLTRILSKGGLDDIAEIASLLEPFRTRLGSRVLLNAPAAWEMLLRMYRRSQPESPFLDYFWTWRALLGGLYSMLLADLPPARLYHAVSTGYAGLYAARAHLVTGRPILLTEHGIYTNERRVEIAMADWLYELPSAGLEIDESRRGLKDLWIDTFVTYSRACYEASSKVITLYEGNQQFQLEDGALPETLSVIPNGIDYEKYASVSKGEGDHPPTIALIGRVVPIKDVKTFIRACAVLRLEIPDLQALTMGPTDEDADYFGECAEMVEYLGLQQTVSFTGRVKLEEYLGRIDVLVMTSISEAQPLVILEAGAAGVPAVVSDVGACREMILGRPAESPNLGPGGIVTPLSNPAETAAAVSMLLKDREFYRRCSSAIRERVRRYYNKTDLDRTYRELYEFYRFNKDLRKGETFRSWQASASNFAN
jgi:polysaccharide biosynthesis protein PelF